MIGFVPNLTPYHSASLSDYDAYALLTKASHYAPMNSSNTLTIVDTTSLFSKRRSNEFTRSHAMKHSNPVTLPQTNPVGFRLLSHTILLFALYQVSYKNILKSFRLPHDATTSFKRHLLLLSDEPITLGTFLLDLNYVLINKLTTPRDPFDAAKIALPAAISPTAVQIKPFLPLGK